MSSSIWMALMLLPWTARADGWDDFANNLATDLAPLLALFGEQVTKQYLSESLNWVDNFIFAMAPLGIITAVVSVIRVCGGSSLRAFVGRAQEGRGVAEAELCSSTSPDVCELWNNGGIARVFGQPQILEVVYDPDTGAEGLYDQDGMATEGIFLPKDYFGTPISSGKKFAVACKRWEEEDAGSHDAETSPGLFAPKPNLSLNIGITKPPKGVFVTGAVFGFSLQTSVLIFAAWATFIGKLKKDGETMRPWSFPLTCIGTICLGAGMFLCALLIERSTGERIFRWRGEQGKAPLRYYLQAANQTVGDQKFEAFAHRDRLEHYITSWKVDSSDSRTLIGLSEATLVWVAVGAALGGFILQFVGLRAMHSSVAMFQFGIIVVMAVVRAGLRTRRLDDNANSLKNMKDRLQGHELDWLAMKLEQDRFSELGRRDDSSHDAGFWEVMGPSSDFGLNNRLKVSVIEGENIPVIKQGSSIVVQQREKLDIASSPEEIAASDDLLVSTRHSASRILKHRARLARITASDTAESRWQAEIRTHAINLKNAIEETATLLFSGEYHYTGDWSDDARLAWPIRARVQVSNVLTATESISLHIKKVLKRWETDLSTLEAILSLWMWSLESDDFSGKLRDISKTRDTPSDRIFALGSNRETELAIRDFQLWVRTNASPVVGRLERLSTSSVLQSDQKRYFGWQTVSNNLPSSTEPDTVISVPTTNSIPMMCAQDVYSSFLDFTVKNLSGIGGGTSVRMMEQTAWPSASGSDSIQLSNPLADSIAAIFERNGLGSIADADLCLFSCLRKHSKLPSSDIAHERARENAMKLRSMGNWQKAENILKWIYEQCVAKFHDMQSSSSQTYRRNLHERRSGIVDAATDLAELWRKSMRESQNRDQLGYDGVVWMLNNSVDPLPVEIKNLYGWLAWAIACENGDEERKIMLRNVGADILPLPEDVMPGSLVIKSLLDAIRYQARAKSLLFLKRGKWVNEQDEFGRTPLIWAAINGWPDVVQSLLELGARPELRDRRNRNAFSYTAEKGWISVLQLLLGVVRDPDEEDSFGRTPISYAAEHGHTAAVEMIYNSGLIHIRSRDFQGRTILHQVAEAGDGNLALLLFTLGMKSLPKQQSVNLWTPLHVAVKNEAFGIVRLLLANGAELEAKTVAGETALHIAAKKNSLPVITFLLERNTSLTERDAKGWTALHGAAAVGNYEMVRVLLEHKANIALTDHEGYTPLHLAAARRNTSVVALLLASGAIIEAQTTCGQIGLQVALSSGQPQIASLLLTKTPMNLSTWEGPKSNMNRDCTAIAATFIGQHRIVASPLIICLATLILIAYKWIYFQSNEGGIRQAWRNPLHQKQWLGGEQKDIVCLGKRFTPIAATSWLSGQGLNIRVYYLDKDNYVRERICVDPRYQQRDPDWEDEPRWTPGELNVFNFRAASHSQLAVTSWGDGHISLCYQDTNQTICELRGIWDDRGPAIWRKSLQLYDAIVATSLAITTFNIGREGKKGIRLIYQGVDRNIREQIWDDGELFSSRRSKIEILPGASIAAIKLRSNHTQVVLSSPSITFRSLVATVPRSWTAVQVERIGKPLGTQLAVIRDQADYRVYSFTADGCLIETRKWDGEWDGHLILYCDEALRAAAGEN